MAATMTASPLSPSQIASYAKLARTGRHLGLGRANKDRAAQRPDELMFLQGEQVAVLSTRADVGHGADEDEHRWLGYCEGVVGLVRPSDLDLDSPLSDPPPTPSSSTLRPASASKGISEASQAASRALQRLAAQRDTLKPEPETDRRVRQRTTSVPRPPATVRFDSPTAASTSYYRPRRYDSLAPQPRSRVPTSPETLVAPQRQTSLEATPPRSTSLHPPNRGYGDTSQDRGRLRTRTATETMVVGLGLGAESARPPAKLSTALAGPASTRVGAVTPDCLPYLRSPTPTDASTQKSYFDSRSTPSAAPLPRVQHSQTPSNSSIPTVLASPLLDAARTPPASAWHSPVWGVTNSPHFDDKTPRPRRATMDSDHGDTDDDEAGQEILATYAQLPSPSSPTFTSADDVASRLRRQVETSHPLPSTDVVVLASPPASSCESTPTSLASAPTPEWTSASSSSSDSSEPGTPSAPVTNKTARTPSSPPLARKPVSPELYKTLPSRTSSVMATANSLQDIVGMSRSSTEPTPAFRDLSKRPAFPVSNTDPLQPDPKRSPRSRLGRRTISTPTLTLHTNRALETAIGIPAVPHPPSMSALPQSPAAAPPRPALPQIAVSPTHVSEAQVPTHRLVGEVSPVSPVSPHSLYSYPSRSSPAMSPVSPSSDSARGSLPRTPPPSAKMLKTKSLGPMRSLRGGLSSSRSSPMQLTQSFPGDPRTPPPQQHRPVGPEDYRHEEVTVRGGPSFEIVKPNLRRLQRQASQGHASSGGSRSSMDSGSRHVLTDDPDGVLSESEEADKVTEEGFAIGLRPSARAKERVRSQLFDVDINVAPVHRLARPNETIDEYGFFRPSETVRDLVGGPRLDGSREEDTRAKEAKWLAVLASTSASSARGSKKLKKLARAGIPNSLRARAWAHMVNVDEFKCQGVWERLAEKGMMEETYEEIEKDLQRCFPDHKDFRDPNSPMIGDLRTLLRAFAQYSSQFEPHLRVGYTQGLGVVAGFLLMHAPGEEAFWILVAIVRRLCPGWWSKSLGGFRRDSLVFEKLLDAADPVLAKHLRAHDMDVNMWLPAQFLQLFIRTLPWPCLLRAFDVFLLEGPKFLFRIGLAILNVTRDALLGLDNQMDLLEFLLNVPQHRLDAAKLLPTAFAITLKSATMDRLRAKCEAQLARPARR